MEIRIVKNLMKIILKILKFYNCNNNLFLNLKCRLLLCLNIKINTKILKNI